MATSIAIEEESGTGSGRLPEHNGYYAGDFWAGRRQTAISSRSISTPRIGRSRLPAGTLEDAV